MKGNRTRRTLERWLSERLQGRSLLFVTLTSSVSVDRSAFSAALPKLVHRIKRRVLGRADEHKDLALIGTMEKSYRDGVHAHLIIEDPYSLSPTKVFASSAPVSDLIKEEWAGLWIGGRPWAQDVQPVYDLDGAIGYVLKTIGRTSNLDELELSTLCLPHRAAT